MKEYVVTRANLVGRRERKGYEPSYVDVWGSYWDVCDELERIKYTVIEQQHKPDSDAIMELSSLLCSKTSCSTRSIYSYNSPEVVVLNDLQSHADAATHRIVVMSQEPQLNASVQRDLLRFRSDYWQAEESTNISIVGAPEKHFKTGYFGYLRQHAPTDMFCERSEARNFFCKVAESYGRTPQDAKKDLEVFRRLDERMVSSKIETKKDSAYDLREVSV